MITTNKRKKSTKPKKINNLRHAEYYDMQDTFDGLFAQAMDGGTFDRLMDSILSRDNILLAYRNIKGNNGSVTPGTDRLTIQDVEKFTPDGLVQKVRNITKNYSPRAVRRKEIPKPHDPSKTRPLGIPCIWDRLIQQCILQVLEPVCEAKFCETSYGFRPNRSQEHAVAAAYRLMQKSHMGFVVEFDIKGFFDNVDHSKLMKQMWALGIRDKRLLYIIKRVLQAPIQLEDGTMVTPDKGTPQGGIISPLLANIVLNELDWWIESQWQDNPVVWSGKPCYDAKGGPIKSNGYKAMRATRLKEMYMVRYADDFRVFCPTADVAFRAKTAVTQWLKERLRLDISPEKTRVVSLENQYSEFLGIKMKLRQKKGKMVVHSRVGDKAIQRIRAEAKQKVRAIVRPQKGNTDIHAIHDYNAFVMGVHNYYRMATAVIVDFAEIGYRAWKIFYRLGKRLKKSPRGEVTGAVVERYGESAQMRYLKNLPIAPIAYTRTKPPMNKKRSVQKYTPEGRKEIHKNLGINLSMLGALVRQPLYGRSAEYADNRLSLYCAQYGKCAVTGQVFEISEDIHCHHKLPRSKGGNDKYQNLILVHETVHILIHATTESTIEKYLALTNLNKKQLAKLNKLRVEVGNLPIAT
ncbi:MAG: group II intron reverse transcriptase/maturase [Clostridiales bacterium]|nr:group II intron reverse transcriptase/maturase [Clostridiales bacterium]